MHKMPWNEGIFNHYMHDIFGNMSFLNLCMQETLGTNAFPKLTLSRNVSILNQCMHKIPRNWSNFGIYMHTILILKLIIIVLCALYMRIYVEIRATSYDPLVLFWDSVDVCCLLLGKRNTEIALHQVKFKLSAVGKASQDASNTQNRSERWRQTCCSISTN